jgi:hypothetical protein
MGPVSRRAYKTDIEYIDDETRAEIAEHVLTTSTCSRDLYNDESTVLATLQEQRKQVDALKKQVEALENGSSHE